MRALKILLFGIDLLSAILFTIFYLYCTYTLFLPPYGVHSFLFIGFFMIFFESLFEAFIICYKTDAESGKCPLLLLLLFVAIILLYSSTWELGDQIKDLFFEPELGAVIVGVITFVCLAIISPVLISKYASWVLMIISLMGEHDSKGELIFSTVSIGINIVVNICVEIVVPPIEFYIGYIIVFVTLSIASLIITLES